MNSFDDLDIYDEDEEKSPAQSLKILKNYLTLDNIADELEIEQLDKIAGHLIRGFDEDLQSMKSWISNCHEILELAKLEKSPKNYPFNKAANVKTPIIVSAALQWASRDKAEFVTNGHIVKAKVLGKDRDGAKKRLSDRICTYMDWDLQENMPSWEKERDKLRFHTALVGCAHTKTFYDPIMKKNRSVFIPYDQFVINDGVRSLEEAPRATHILAMSTNDIISHQRAGLYSKLLDQNGDELEWCTITKDKMDSKAVDHEILEMHCYLDLDGDEREEPYIVTLHLALKKILRIVARFDEDAIDTNSKNEIQYIRADNYFTQYVLLENPEGTYFGWGFGALLLDLNATYNTAINQLINAGHLATVQGGLIDKDLRLKKENSEVSYASFQQVDLMPGDPIANHIFQWNFKEPSQVLFALLGTLNDFAKQLSSNTDVLSGQQDATNASPNTTLMLMRNGLTVINSIQRRMSRSTADEFMKLFKLNKKYLDDKLYLQVVDPDPEEMQEVVNQFNEVIDFSNPGIQVVPIIDGNDATKSEGILQAQALATLYQPFMQSGVGSGAAIWNEIVDKMGTENASKLYAQPPAPPPPSPNMLKVQSDHELGMASHQLEVAKFQAGLQDDASKIGVNQAKAEALKARALKDVVDAHTAPHTAQLAADKLRLDTMKADYGHTLQRKALELNAIKTHSDITNVDRQNTTPTME